MRLRASKRWLAVCLCLSFALTLVVTSRKYIWMYLTWPPDPRPQVADLLRDPAASSNPEILLAEANRLAWFFNWPKAEPLYIRAEQLFKLKGDERNEVYSRVGRTRAQSETMSWVDVSEILGKELDLPIAKSDKTLRLWCLAAKGYTDLEINPASAKRVWTEAQGIAHDYGEREWEARAKGELGFVAFLEGNTRRAAIMVGDAFLSVGCERIPPCGELGAIAGGHVLDVSGHPKSKIVLGHKLCIALLQLNEVLLQLEIPQQCVVVIRGIVNYTAPKLCRSGADRKTHDEHKDEKLAFHCFLLTPQRSEGNLWLS